MWLISRRGMPEPLEELRDSVVAGLLADVVDISRIGLKVVATAAIVPGVLDVQSKAN